MRVQGIAIAAMGVFAAAPAAAAESPPPATLSPRQAEAARLMLAGRVAEAKALLIALRARSPADNETAFLLAMIASQEGDHPRAIHLFREILSREPGAVRVRLELARTFFLAKDYDNAERQFRFARAGRLPPEAMANIDDFLDAIRRLRSGTYRLSVALAPDTNLNAGPQSRTVDIFGLPFELSDQTRRRSGVGAAVDAFAEWSPRIGATDRLRLAGQLHRSEYSGGAFDDMTVSAYGGVRLLRGHWEISPLATVFARWYGDRAYNHGVGASLQVIDFPSPRYGISGVVGVQQIDYSAMPEQGGPAVSASFSVLHTLSPISLVTAGLAITRQGAQVKALSSTAAEVRLAYQRDLPGGFQASIEPSYARIAYDAALPAFGVVRTDRQWTLQATLLNRRIEYRGFTPRLLYAHTHNASRIALYAYDRDRFEVGLTRDF